MTDCAVTRRTVHGFCARTKMSPKQPQSSAPWFSLSDLSAAKDQQPVVAKEEPHTPQVHSTPSLCFTGDTSDMFLDMVLPGKTPNSRSPSCPEAPAANTSAADSELPDVKMPVMDEIAVTTAAVGGSYPRISAVLHRFNILTRESETPTPCPPPSLVKGPSNVVIDSTILSDPVLARLASAMPKRFASTEWRLLYSTQAHGFSLGTLYKRVNGSGAVANSCWLKSPASPLPRQRPRPWAARAEPSQRACLRGMTSPRPATVCPEMANPPSTDRSSRCARHEATCWARCLRTGSASRSRDSFSTAQARASSSV